MKKIRMIEKLRTRYKKYFIGQQAEIEETPFGIRIGVLNTLGEVENGYPTIEVVNFPNFNLVATTDDQVVFTVPNRYYSKLTMYLRSTGARVSWDFRLFTNALRTGTLGFGEINNTLGAQQWFRDIVSDSRLQSYTGDVPFGPDVELRLVMDNNHATEALAIQHALYFHNPPR